MELLKTIKRVFDEYKSTRKRAKSNKRASASNVQPSSEGAPPTTESNNMIVYSRPKSRKSGKCGDGSSDYLLDNNERQGSIKESEPKVCVDLKINKKTPPQCPYCLKKLKLTKLKTVENNNGKLFDGMSEEEFRIANNFSYLPKNDALSIAHVLHSKNEELRRRTSRLMHARNRIEFLEKIDTENKKLLRIIENEDEIKRKLIEEILTLQRSLQMKEL